MKHYEEEREGEERIENLKELVNAALAFQQEGGDRQPDAGQHGAGGGGHGAQR